MDKLVLCSGSRSGPLAIAASGLGVSSDLQVFTSIDERSAAFMALGLSTASGKATLVITTSGTAVANLFPAAIEADRSCQPLIFLTADRPLRLKNCGSNQTVNQEEFLLPACRLFEQGDPQGIHLLTKEKIQELVDNTWEAAHLLPGPVHINLPIEEPLHPSLAEQDEVWNGWEPSLFEDKIIIKHTKETITKTTQTSINIPFLDPSKPGIIVIGPWRGSQQSLDLFRQTLEKWQSYTNWPIFADPLSGIRSTQNGIVSYWELLLINEFVEISQGLQVLRLGPTSSSRALQEWLGKVKGNQVLITEGEKRPIDPLRLSKQYSHGFYNWYMEFINNYQFNKQTINLHKNNKFYNDLFLKDQKIKVWFESFMTNNTKLTEPSIAYWLPKYLPKDISIMLSASSPVRDWLTFAGPESLVNRCFGFRGASGIDGNLSLAIGLSNVVGRLILVCGDLSLLHDTNGWLFLTHKSPPLIIFLIDNCGGGIFEQLGISKLSKGDFKQVFTMPQALELLELAKLHRIPTRDIKSLDELRDVIEWCLEFSGPVFVRVATDSANDASLRNNINDQLRRYI